MLFAIKYNYELDLSKDEQDKIIASNDCILLLISYLYAKKYSISTLKTSLEEKAKSLQFTDFDSYWLFIYECLSERELKGNFESDWKTLKQNRVSFIKNEWRR